MAATQEPTGGHQKDVLNRGEAMLTQTEFNGLVNPANTLVLEDVGKALPFPLL